MRKCNKFNAFQKLLLLPFFVAVLAMSSCDLSDSGTMNGLISTPSDNKESRLKEIVNNLDADGYAYQLKAYANNLAEEWYGGGGPAGWVVKDCYILNNEVESVVLSDRPAKKISCTVHVDMEGAMGLGLRLGSVDIWVEGTLNVNNFDGEQYDVVFTRGDYRKVRSYYGGRLVGLQVE